MKKWMIALAVLACAFLLTVMVVYVICDSRADDQLADAYAALRGDGVPMSVEEITPPPLPVEDNAAADYDAAVAKLQLIPMKDGNLHAYGDRAKGWIIKGKATPEQYHELRVAFASPQFQSAMKHFETATQKLDYHRDLDYAAGYDVNVDFVFQMRTLAWLAAASAVMIAPEQADLAWERLIAVLRMARHGAREPLTVIQLSRITAIAIACESIQLLAQLSPPTEAQTATIDKLLSELDTLENFALSLHGERILRGSWGFGLSSSEYVELANLDSIYVVDTLIGRLPTRTLDEAAYLRMMRDAHAIATTPYAPSDLKVIEDHVRIRGKHYYFLTRIIAPLAGRFKQRFVQLQAMIRITRGGLALIVHRQAHGAFPDNLNILGEIGDLNDPFANGPLSYQHTDDKTIIYSVGCNQVNDSGSTDETDTREGDQAWCLVGGDPWPLRTPPPLPPPPQEPEPQHEPEPPKRRGLFD